MKTIAVFSAFILSSLISNATARPVSFETLPFANTMVEFEAFRAHRQQDGVALAWINSNSDVQSFVIQHSFDGSSFTTIAEVAPVDAAWNKFYDGAALPGYNYYRIIAVSANGSVQYSEVEMVRIVKKR